MTTFAELHAALDRTNKTGEKLALLERFFRLAPDPEKLWTLALLTGRRPRRPVSTARLREWAAARAGIPGWLFEECYQHAGDLGETLHLLLPPAQTSEIRPTGEWFRWLDDLRGLSESEQRALIIEAWDGLPAAERLVFNKLITGGFRVGVSRALVIRALAAAMEMEPDRVARAIMGNWDPRETVFGNLWKEDPAADLARPYPFCLAHPFTGNPADTLGTPAEWLAEWKWDGIRGQLIKRGGDLFLWSRGEEPVGDRFPELLQLAGCLPDGTVMDGEILPWRDGRPLGFSVLQTRIGRKALTTRLLREAPVVFTAYDLLEWEGRDFRGEPLDRRRERLEHAVAAFAPRRGGAPLLRLSEEVPFQTWEELAALRDESRDRLAEGLMIKKRDAPYPAGRPRGIWWKWKVDPFSVDAVLVQSQPGHGRRSTLHTDHTFAVWSDGALVPFAKAYSGLTDEEIRRVDRFVKTHTTARHGPVRTVAPELVFEIGFEHIARSTRHRAGVAVRFPRILRWREDKPAAEADTLETLKSLTRLPDIPKAKTTQLELF